MYIYEEDIYKLHAFWKYLKIENVALEYFIEILSKQLSNL